ncbi:MAG: hypothetical protein M1570_03305 [Chloroflexi bacterium]|nr:hypothetical protein [Chloroflexota bacterium]
MWITIFPEFAKTTKDLERLFQHRPRKALLTPKQNTEGQSPIAPPALSATHRDEQYKQDQHKQHAKGPDDDRQQNCGDRFAAADLVCDGSAFAINHDAPPKRDESD